MRMALPDLLPITAAAVETARSDVESRLNQAAAWVEWLRSGPTGSTCVICGGTGAVEVHHIAGRRHSDLTVPTCIPCHRRLSERQNGWDPRWLTEERGPALDRSLLLRGLSDLCEEKGRFDGAYHELGKRLRARYAVLARETVGDP